MSRVDLDLDLDVDLDGFVRGKLSRHNIYRVALFWCLSMSRTRSRFRSRSRTDNHAVSQQKPATSTDVVVVSVIVVVIGSFYPLKLPTTITTTITMLVSTPSSWREAGPCVEFSEVAFNEAHIPPRLRPNQPLL